ncbi:MAG: DUF6198 family protein [Methanomassiliicoccus sp.]|nr:DUF6198 family protein [Methanomassiliicoccus sp.]
MKNKVRLPGEVALAMGLLLISFAVTLMVRADFGISTLSSLPYVLSRIFTGLSFGAWNLVFQVTLLIILLAVTKRFKAGYVISFILTMAFGTILDIFSGLLSALPSDLWLRAFYAVAAYFIMCVAISLMIGSKVPLMIVDSFIYDLTKHHEVSFRRMKTFIDIILVCLSAALSFVFLGTLTGVGIGTIIMALITGTGVHAATHLLREIVVIDPLSKTLGRMAA